MFSFRNKKKYLWIIFSTPSNLELKVDLIDNSVISVWKHSLQPSGLPRSGKNIWKMKFFPGQGKVKEFYGWSGKFRKDLESLGKVRECENKWLWQEDFRKFILFKRGKDGEQILYFKSNPQIWSDTVSTIKLKNENDFILGLSEGMENCKMSGKSQGICRWMISCNPTPCCKQPLQGV